MVPNETNELSFVRYEWLMLPIDLPFSNGFPSKMDFLQKHMHLAFHYWHANEVKSIQLALCTFLFFWVTVSGPT